MEFTFINFATCVFIFIVLFLIRVCIGYFKHYRSYKEAFTYLQSTPDLNKNSKEGDYVRVIGKISNPKDETPINRHKCSYWHLKVWADFKSKIKKPGKGMQTHRPLLVSETNEQQPLILKHGNQVINILSTELKHSLLNPELSETTHTKPPLEAVKSIAKPKYTGYRAVEIWLPEHCPCVLVGKIEHISQNMTILTNGPKRNKPLLIFNESEETFPEYFNKKISRYFINFSCITISTLIAVIIAFYSKHLAFPFALLVPQVMYTAYSKGWKK